MLFYYQRHALHSCLKKKGLIVCLSVFQEFNPWQGCTPVMKSLTTQAWGRIRQGNRGSKKTNKKKRWKDSSSCLSRSHNPRNIFLIFSALWLHYNYTVWCLNLLMEYLCSACKPTKAQQTSVSLKQKPVQIVSNLCLVDSPEAATPSINTPTFFLL